MKKYWVSWWTGTKEGEFELHSPWWISGESWDKEGNDRSSICAAVKAESVEAAEQMIYASYDHPPEHLDFRFISERADDWSPFGDRFRKADWMTWE